MLGRLHANRSLSVSLSPSFSFFFSNICILYTYSACRQECKLYNQTSSKQGECRAALSETKCKGLPCLESTTAVVTNNPEGDLVAKMTFSSSFKNVFICYPNFEANFIAENMGWQLCMHLRCRSQKACMEFHIKSNDILLIGSYRLETHVLSWHIIFQAAILLPRPGF